MKILSLLLAGAVTACAGTYQPRYSYNEILIVNNSRQPVRDVKITVSSSGRVFSCGSIAPLGICSNRFARRPYEMNPIRVTWTFGQRTRQTDEFVVPVPATLYASLPLRGVLAISPEGEVAAYFEQDSPGGP